MIDESHRISVLIREFPLRTLDGVSGNEGPSIEATPFDPDPHLGVDEDAPLFIALEFDFLYYASVSPEKEVSFEHPESFIEPDS